MYKIVWFNGCYIAALYEISFMVASFFRITKHSVYSVIIILIKHTQHMHTAVRSQSNV